MTNTTDGLQVTYEFANFRLLPREKQLVCGEKPVKLQPKAFDTLLMLVENQGRLVEKDNFLKGLWPNTFVEEATLAHCVSELRRTLRRRTVEPNSSRLSRSEDTDFSCQ